MVGSLVVVTLALTAFGGGSPNAGTALPPETTSPGAGSIRPRPTVLATVGNLRIQLPIPVASVTAIGYHGSNDGALALQPSGRQGNEGLLARLWRNIAGSGHTRPVWYALDGRNGTEVLDIGASEGTDVYAPVEGSVVSISDVVIDGRRIGARIDLRPSKAPSTTVSLVNIEPDPSLAVGSPVIAAASKLGTVANIASVEEQALAKHTADDGNNIAISVYPSSSLVP